jgi:tRNA (adenine37-N6)-methyltransferase
MTTYEFQPIGYVRSCFREKFGIPRQPGLIPEARASLEILPPYNRPEAFRELADYSHIWLTFVFHASLRDNWKATVRPPRLGGNKRVGVFASRSPFRPNPIGLSVVRLERLELENPHVCLHLSGIDLLDGTPVLDIKPYLPYADAIPDAKYGYAPAPSSDIQAIQFDERAASLLDSLPDAEAEQLKQLICGILRQDPRPGYRRGQLERHRYGMRLLDFDVHWEIRESSISITGLIPLPVLPDPDS